MKLKITSGQKSEETKKTVVEGDGKLDIGEFELEMWDSRYMLKNEEAEEKWPGWCKPSCVPITIILILIILVVLLPVLNQKWQGERRQDATTLINQRTLCKDTCRYTLTESIPEGLNFTNSSVRHLSTFESWKNLLVMAEETIDIASFYWTLRGSDIWHDPSDWQGEEIFQRLLYAGHARGIQVRITQNMPSATMQNHDTAYLQEKGAAQVRSLNFQELVGNGILHTKMWLVDGKHIYVGSANFDWRSLTQVKELGVVIYNCSCLGEDMAKIFEVYWQLGAKGAKVPDSWPPRYQTVYNKDNPMDIAFNNSLVKTYLSSSPPSFCPKGRTVDIESILDVMDKAREFIYVAVMDYLPATAFSKRRFWPVIDDKLRAAAIERGVLVRLLISKWNNTKSAMPYFLHSLQAINQAYRNVHIEVKFFVVPSFTPEQEEIPFARVNHNKYMVTDNAAYIGTSNWSGDYFMYSGGIGFIVNQTEPGPSSNSSANMRQQLQDVFERDWFSEYASPLSHFF